MAMSAAAAVSADPAKLDTGTDGHTMDMDGDPFASDVEEDKKCSNCTYKNSCR